jgi:hypothetical protein
MTGPLRGRHLHHRAYLLPDLVRQAIRLTRKCR